MKHGLCYGTLLRLFVIGVWISLFGALLFRDVFVKSVDLREIQALQQGREESYQGIFFKKERIGYVRNRFVPAGNNTIRMEQDALL
ncbi:MAG: transglutaminase domain-containing protein, partial [Desulfobulbaceae bacterium]|nr:transglutaminase domain-containing protein [Desulfobulbaceae bacterium]